MKAKYFYVALFGLSTLLGTTGCEDRLNIPKHGNMGSQEDFYKTDADAMQALSSLYNAWGGNYYNWFFVKICWPTMYGQAVADEVITQRWNGSTNILSILTIVWCLEYIRACTALSTMPT